MRWPGICGSIDEDFMRRTAASLALTMCLSPAMANERGESFWADAAKSETALVRACKIDEAPEASDAAATWDVRGRTLVLLDLNATSNTRYILMLLERDHLEPFCIFRTDGKRSDGCGGLMTDTWASCAFDLMLKTAKAVRISQIPRDRLATHSDTQTCGSIRTYIQQEFPDSGSGGGIYLCDVVPENGEPYRLAPLNE